MKPITRKITRLSDGAHTGWSLYVEDYERAVSALGKGRVYTAIGEVTIGTVCVRAALKAIGIVPPKKAKGAK